MKIRLLLALTVAVFALAAPAKEFLVFFGTYTGPMSKGIYASHLDAATGRLSQPELAAETPSPCYLAVSPNGKCLYAANSMPKFNGEKAGPVSAFVIDKHSAHVTLLNQKSSSGLGPCYVSTDASGQMLLDANYADGSVKSFKLDDDGSIGADGSYIRHHGSSINTNRQAGPHAHFIEADPSNRFALACDLGTDKVMIYKINPATGTLTEHSLATVPPGSGPRHLAFSPNGKFAYVVSEMGCTVTTFAWDSDAGKLDPLETVSALPPGVGVQPNFTAAEILTSGNFVYATLRGHDSVSVLAADPQTGRLKFVQNIPSDGKVPRGLGIDPTGHWLLVGNQTTDNVAEFSIDSQTGRLSPTGQQLKIGSPVDVKFVEEN